MAVPEFPRYHLVGAAGVGMSALAEALLGQGVRVSASDRYVDTGQDLPVIRQLAAAGVAWVPQDGRGVDVGLRSVVVSTAIEPDNPDLVTARRLGVPVQHRSAILAELAARGRCAAVAGTSGKSTVTGMTGWILEQCGRDPNVVSGAPVRQWMRADATGSVRVGQSDLWVIEADESDRSLLAYTPEWAVITNQSADHFALAETKLLFAEFARRVRRSALGVGAAADYLDGFAPRVEAGRSRFTFRGVPCEVNLPGRHNAEDGLHALALCEALGVPVADGAAALAGFKGVYRRLEPVWQGAGWAVYDDYAHNPAKIAAAWQALAPYYERMVAVWRPHGYGPLRAMAADLGATFANLARPEDRLVILPVYDAGGTADRNVQSDTLAAALVERGVAAVYAPDNDAVFSAIRQAVWQRSLVVLTLGARDPGLPGLARAIGRELAAAVLGLPSGAIRGMVRVGRYGNLWRHTMSREREEGTDLQLDFGKIGKIAEVCRDVLPVAVQHADTHEVILVAYTNRQAFEASIAKRSLVLWSTSRNELWEKGATSGETFELVDVFVNCEQNSLVYRVRPRRRAICHTKNAAGEPRNCYYRRIDLQTRTLENLDP